MDEHIRPRESLSSVAAAPNMPSSPGESPARPSTDRQVARHPRKQLSDPIPHARHPYRLIVAHDDNRLIGTNGALPWSHPEDLKHFRRETMGHAIIMGRKTFSSIGQALPGRHNIVVTNNPDWSAPGALPVASLEMALELASTLDPLPFVIGGATLYDRSMAHAQELLVTHVAGQHEGDTYLANYEAMGFVCVDVQACPSSSSLRFMRWKPAASAMQP